MEQSPMAIRQHRVVYSKHDASPSFQEIVDYLDTLSVNPEEIEDWPRAVVKITIPKGDPWPSADGHTHTGFNVELISIEKDHLAAQDCIKHNKLDAVIRILRNGVRKKRKHVEKWLLPGNHTQWSYDTSWLMEHLSTIEFELIIGSDDDEEDGPLFYQCYQWFNIPISRRRLERFVAASKIRPTRCFFLFEGKINYDYTSVNVGYVGATDNESDILSLFTSYAALDVIDELQEQPHVYFKTNYYHKLYIPKQNHNPTQTTNPSDALTAIANEESVHKEIGPLCKIFKRIFRDENGEIRTRFYAESVLWLTVELSLL